MTRTVSNPRLIGVIAPNLDSVTSSRMIMYMHDVLLEKGYVPVVMYTNHGKDTDTIVDALLGIGVKGLVVFADFHPEKQEKLAKELNIPVILIGRKIAGGNYIIYDDYMAGCSIGDYVASIGSFRNYLYVGVSKSSAEVGVIRKEGVYTALKNRGAENIDFVEADFTMEKAEEKVHAYLETHKPDAIICASDKIAMACYKEIRAKGWRIPEDISICGFGGYAITQMLTPALTTVRYPNELAGLLAAEMMIGLVEKDPDVVTQRILDYQLIEGGSVKLK